MTDDLVDSDTFEIPPGFAPMNWSRGFGRQIGPFYERSEPGGGFTRAFLVADHHTNGMKNCHGGMLMAFADTVFGHSVSLRHRTRYWVTIRMLTDFLSPAVLGDWVEGTSELVGDEDGLYTVKGRIWAGSRTILTGTGIFKTMGERAEKR
jgi:acyl-coenzyme A thioesterase PaaI-like protein